MKLKGILDFSLGNFLCLRGFAPMGVLQDISKADDRIQRVPRDDRLKEVGDYLKKGEYLFFPEVILCVAAHSSEVAPSDIVGFWESVQVGQPKRAIRFSNGLRIASSVTRSRGVGDIRAVKNFQTATLHFNSDIDPLFSRIDGNHRLAASKDAQVRERSTPFCIIFCRDLSEFKRFSSALFHIINYKQVALPKEHNLRLILQDEELFPDDRLKRDPSFGWPYYQARQLHAKLDLDFLPNLKPLIESEPLSFLVDQFSFFGERGILNDNENAIRRLKEALAKANAVFDEYPALTGSRNRGILAALLCYLLKSPAVAPSFARWVTDNHLQLIPNSSTPDLLDIFDHILNSRKRTIFVSMPFGKTKPDDHFAIIERVAREVSEEGTLNPPLKVQRVDWFHDGTSYEIVDKIVDMISDCGLLIGNLTYGNPNVYHEVGFVMGKARASGKEVADMLLFLDESVTQKEKLVGFNLRGIKQLRFTKPELEFAPALKTNLQKFFLTV